MNPFITYIEDTLHITADVSAYEHPDALPLYLRNGYELHTLMIQSVPCLLVRPVEKSNLPAMRKHIDQLKKLTGFDCTLCLENVRIYTKDKMLSEGIPFVIAGQQIYMPFLGVALSNNEIRDVPHIEQISFTTQRLLLTAIYEGWTQATLTDTAKALELSKMSITRCFDELQALGLNAIRNKGRIRHFIWDNGRRALWDAVFLFFRNPVAQEYQFGIKLDIENRKLGGMSALCHYSMLSDNPYMVYSVSKEEAKTMKLNKIAAIPKGETPEMVVQVMRYDLEYKDSVAIDPLTAIISLKNDVKNDPRVEAAIDYILEECLHD